MTQAVVIKSKCYGIHLVLNPDVPFPELLEAVIEKFADSGDFFKNANVGISFEGYELTPKQEYELIAVIEAHTSINIVCIMEEEQVREACVLAETEALIRERVTNHAVFHYGSLKPGDDLHADAGLVVIGNVPKGAKVTAGGNLIIFGTLDGFAHAGAYGDLAAYIAALSIDTGQIQIGKILFLPPENSGKKKGGFLRRRKEGESFSPQIARVRDGHVIMEPCTKDLF
ncbi:Septum site-determining protein MinC [Eubacterium plexicaudatum ASF492]|uniref:Probable septum site-determining protein MinC n=1 Tax=Eubacterium plexicaudatum ASF492 TaxID=1235802 RepID=N2B656_9FIRM|nr:Septum site-determining protein MinC [Eubacterium plexicaudatum ASF492]